MERHISTKVFVEHLRCGEVCPERKRGQSTEGRGTIFIVFLKRSQRELVKGYEKEVSSSTDSGRDMAAQRPGG